MSTRQLSEAIVDGGVRQVNFANGRLLSAEDMRQEQLARGYADSLLGKARGHGISFGLEVSRVNSSGALPRVTIRSGLAINRRGHALALGEDIELSLVRPAMAAAPADSTFHDCLPPQAGVFAPNAGIYVLVICPASVKQGRAPVSGLGNASVPCAAQFQIDGVQFRLIPTDAGALLDDPNFLRNRIAYACFGVTDALVMQTSPYDALWQRTGLLDTLRANDLGLTDCDVPLATLYWTAAGIQYVDVWSARRRLIEPSANQAWPLLFDDRRAAEAEAMCHQFQEQIEEIMDLEASPQTIKASDRFQFLPPAGMIPMFAGADAKGFDIGQFFGDQGASEIGTIDGAQLRPLFQEALAYEPILFASGERVRLYVTFENMQAALSQQGRLTLIFTTRHLANRAAARFDFGAFSLGRFASTVVR